MRKAVRITHLALGLVAGILLSIVTVSGAAVVFRDDLDWLHAPAVQPSPMHLTDLDATAAGLHGRWPGVRVTRLLTPVATGAGHEWWLRDDKGTREPGDDESWKAFTDPSTGSLLGDTRGSTLSTALAWLARFHHNLWLGELGGILVGASGLALFGFVATGLWLWWPGLRRLSNGLRLRWSSGNGIFSRDLHNWAGIIGTAPLLLIALTGTMFEFRWMRTAVHYGLGGGEADRPLSLRQRPPPPPADAPRSDVARPADRPRSQGPQSGFDRAVAAAEATGKGQARVINPPRAGRGDGPWTVILDYPGNAGSFSGVVVQVSADGDPALVLDPRDMSVGGWMNAQQWGLHTGTWGGPLSKALYLFAGLLPPLLMATGLLMWRHRHAKQADRPAST